MKEITHLKHKLFLCFLFIFPGVLSAQISNVKYEYSCPCKVTVTYDLATACGGVKLYFSPDTVVIGWKPVTTYQTKTPGHHTVTWKCDTIASHGLFYYKLEIIPRCQPIADAVMINGVVWATHNVDKPGTFVECPQDIGMLYQWNRKAGWSNTDPMVNSNGGNIWDSSAPSGATWSSINDPSPSGYHVPTHAEIQSLTNATNVSSVVTVENGVSGMRFTDTGADGRGNSGNSIFLPYTISRRPDNGSFYYNWCGIYWSSMEYTTNNIFAWTIAVGVGGFDVDYMLKGYAFTIRPVAN